MRPVTVNCPDEDWRGLGDVLAALPWAKMDKEFLEDLAVYMRALTRILGQVTGKNAEGRGRGRAEASASVGPTQGGGPSGAGASRSPTRARPLSLVSKSGAQIDADSHKPFATMTAAAARGARSRCSSATRASPVPARPRRPWTSRPS
jgi:hypothetical protein